MPTHQLPQAARANETEPGLACAAVHAPTRTLSLAASPRSASCCRRSAARSVRNRRSALSLAFSSTAARSSACRTARSRCASCARHSWSASRAAGATAHSRTACCSRATSARSAHSCRSAAAAPTSCSCARARSRFSSLFNTCRRRKAVASRGAGCAGAPIVQHKPQATCTAAGRRQPLAADTSNPFPSHSADPRCMRMRTLLSSSMLR